MGIDIVVREVGDVSGEFAAFVPHGYGETIPEGTFLIEYTGVRDKVRTEADDVFPLMCSDFYVDASEFGNVSRFIRHSCEPNCRAQVWYETSNLTPLPPLLYVPLVVCTCIS